MRAATLLAVLLSLAATFLYITIGIEFAVGPPAPEVLSWWWSNGENRISVSYLAFGFAVFPVLFALWAQNWLRIIRARAVRYVWLGPTLQRDRSYFFALDDPHRERVVLGSRMADCGIGRGTQVNLLFATKGLLRLGPNPEHAIEAPLLKPRRQVLLLLTQYLALGFGLAAAGDVAYQYIGARGRVITANLLPVSTLLALLPLVCLHIFGMINGYLAFQRKTRTLQAMDHREVPRHSLKPGDRISVRFVERTQARASSGDKSRKNFYRVEWTTEVEMIMSAIVAFRTTSKHHAAIEELDRMTEARGEVQCLVAKDFKLRPLVLLDVEGIEWL